MSSRKKAVPKRLNAESHANRESAQDEDYERALEYSETKAYFSKPVNENPNVWLERDNIQIDTSTIPGAGLGAFTVTPRQVGEQLGIYRGYPVSANTQGDYVLQLPGHVLSLDASVPEYSNWTRYANTGSWNGEPLKRNNAVFVRMPKLFNSSVIRIALVATEDIPAGGEIFVDYGNFKHEHEPVYGPQRNTRMPERSTPYQRRRKRKRRNTRKMKRRQV